MACFNLDNICFSVVVEDVQLYHVELANNNAREIE